MNPDIFYLDPNPSGQQTVILLHGLGADCKSWQLQITDLVNENYRPIVLDLPGFGKSLPYSKKWTISSTAKVISEFIEPFAPVYLLGISLGGAIALQTALDYPHLLEKLVLVNTFARLRPQKLKEYPYLIKRLIITSVKGSESQAELVARKVFPQPGQEVYRSQIKEDIINTDPIIYKQAMQSIARFDVRSRLREINHSTLIITGNDDTTVPVETQKQLCRQIRNSRQVYIMDAGHAVSIDQPEKFNRSILDYFNIDSK